MTIMLIVTSSIVAAPVIVGPVIVGLVNVLFVSVCVATKLTSSDEAPGGSVSVFVTPALCGCACIFCPWAFRSYRSS